MFRLTGYRRVLRLAGGIALAALGLAACGGATTSIRIEAGRQPSQAPFVYGTEALFSTTGGLANLNPYSPSFAGEYTIFVPLAIALPPHYGTYIPELAARWRTSSREITIYIRRGVKWQNGTPITATDVADSLVLAGINGNTMWEGVDRLRIPDSGTVELSLKPAVSVQGVLADVLGSTVVPMSQYAQFLPPHPVSTIISYYRAKGAGKAESSTGIVAKLDKKLASFAPPTVIGDGPFRYSKLTAAAFLVTKWPGFWDAGNIHPSSYELAGFSTGEELYGALFAQRVDYAEIGSTEPIVKRWLKTPHSHFSVGNAFLGNAFLISTKHYPLNLVAVRQALAYLLDRPKVSYAAYLGAPEAEVSKYPDGLINTVRDLYLSSSQQHKLNPYTFSPAKAGVLLRAAHFTKKGRWWYLPDGSPFTLTVAAPTDLPDQVIMATVYSKELTNFGIRSTQEGTSYPQYSTLQLEDRYDLSWATYADGNVAPLTELQSLFASTNLVASGEPGMGFGPMGTVPGLGRVNLMNALNHEVATVSQMSDNATTRNLVWDWSRYLNEELPFLSLADVEQPSQFSTSRFTGWPSAHSALWPLIHTNPVGGLIVAMERGYLRPRSA